MKPCIRLANTDDLPALPDLERQAADRFSLADLPEELREQTAHPNHLATALCSETLWVATLDNQRVGFLSAEIRDLDLHINEMDVIPSISGQGIGTALLQFACQKAKSLHLTRVTLTTFSHVPWNAPFYSRRGFSEIEPEKESHLATELQSEWALGLRNRIAMCKYVT